MKMDTHFLHRNAMAWRCANVHDAKNRDVQEGVRESHSTCTLPCPTSKTWTNMDQSLPGRRFSAANGPENPWKCQPFSTPSKASKTSHTVAAVPVPMVSLRLVTQNVVPHYLLLGASRLNKTLVCLVVLCLLYMFINFIPRETSC